MGRHADAGADARPLLTSESYARCPSRRDDDLRNFRSCLRWLCLDQSGSGYRAAVSWAVFLLLAVAVPAVSHFVLAFRPQRRPYDLVVQLSLTAASALSFLTLSSVTRSYGLRRFLFLDKLPGETDRVRLGYTFELNQSFRLLSCFVAPCFAAEVAYKLWWYISGAGRIPFVGNPLLSYCVSCALQLASLIYRISSFFLSCVLFRLICHLQILRLEDFAAVFRGESEVEAVLREHLRLRRQLKVISHRFRVFILAGLIMVTASQFAATLVTLRPHSDDNLFNTGELALCSIVLVTGLLICLRSAAKITHKAQALTGHAAKWHVCATIDSYAVDLETTSTIAPDTNHVSPENDADTDDEEASDIDELICTKIVHTHVNTMAFQKRQALVTYLENNRAGITIFGFTVDRAWLHTIFMLEITLFLWLLGKTVGIS
ncbi:uncharacterized protein LOC103996294 [Musa acuminata AAA Group]|uniref:(wild Malaysian banana) hypothetical protein n=1 Tax=Musa acuminata subsp. malaccensis TaxID=214687 RepID=A0A804KAV1_MUSAM|nr:PREDICTED: uncharacterized protein LOC103996294 [Musa acuminata subsp. malaccensis]CAG1832761.1 unnamed protein product [Musa acuminata subsp. malaccensis]